MAVWLALGSSAQAQSASWFDRAPAQPGIRPVVAQELAPQVPPPLPDLGLTGPEPEAAAQQPDERQIMDMIAPPLPGNCCKGCPSFWYTDFEYMGVNRTEPGATVLSTAISTGGFDNYEPGFRITVGRQRDCLDALELVYAGVYGAVQTNTATSGGTIQSFFATGVGAFNLDDFNNATSQTARYEWNLTNVEVNRRQWGWDIISSVYGPRYINLNEDLTFTSLPNPATTFGQYRVQTRNNLYGYHFGGDMLYPLGPAWNIGGRIRLGGFLNSMEQDTTVINNSTVVTRNSADDINFTFLTELGAFTSYRLHPRCTVKAGYDLWYLWNLALAPDQIDYSPRAGMAGQIDDNSDLFMGLFTVGAEFQW